VFVAIAFLKRDLSLALSYRLSFLLQIVGIFFSSATFYFLSLVFGNTMMPQLEKYGGDYFSFALIGLALISYMNLSLSNFAQSIRDSQMMGTLEIMLLSPTHLSSILISSSLWSYLQTTLNVVMYIAAGAFLFGFSLGQINILGALLVMLLSVASFSGIGILSAAVVLIVKKGDPVNWIISGTSSLLAGVFYPVSVLPGWLEPVSQALPMTYALDAMRLTILKGSSLMDVRGDLLALLAFTAVLTPLGFLAFREALKRAKVEGSLVQY
jgi:ABC-2 type transport system permease protein